MRIISGKWRGRRLVAFKAPSIRPTTDRVKETMFNMVGPDIMGARVLDLFAGTGNLGLEALSRGAEQVVAIDMGRDSKNIIQKNKNLLGVGSEHIFKNQNVLSYVQNTAEKFDYIFVDPPFTQKMASEVLHLLGTNDLLNSGGEVFVEFVKGEEQLDKYSSLCLKKLRNFGDKLLGVYELCEDQNEISSPNKETK